MKTDERIGKLPKWAQEHIENLGTKIRNLEEKLAKQANKGPTRVAVELFTFEDDALFWAPDDTKVRFTLTGEFSRGAMHRSNTWVDVRIERDRLYVVASDSMDVRPQSGNVATIGVVDRS